MDLSVFVLLFVVLFFAIYGAVLKREREPQTDAQAFGTIVIVFVCAAAGAFALYSFLEQAFESLMDQMGEIE